MVKLILRPTCLAPDLFSITALYSLLMHLCVIPAIRTVSPEVGSAFIVGVVREKETNGAGV